MTSAKSKTTLYPNCLHATCPSAAGYSSKHITPHLFLWNTSSRPMYGALPPTNRSDLSGTVEFTSQTDLLPISTCCEALWPIQIRNHLLYKQSKYR